MVRHFRESECGLLEELEPIDENRRYDFNYQQVTLLPREVKVLPVSRVIYYISLLILVLWVGGLYCTAVS